MKRLCTAMRRLRRKNALGAAAIPAMLTAFAVTAALVFPAAAFAAGETQEEAGFSNFTSKREYTENQFRDVPSTRWFAPAVKSVYSLLIMSGKNSTTFAPEDPIKLSEAISMAAKTRHLYNGGDGTLPKTAKAGQRWYTDAVNYATAEGIIKAGDFPNYEFNATRAQLAYIFSGAVPQEALPPISAVDSVPDVTFSTPFHEQILLLYRAGVVSGADKTGSFHPNRNITRAEAASILSMIAVPQDRKSRAANAVSDRLSDVSDASGSFSVSITPAFRNAYETGEVPQINGRPIGSDSPTLYLIQSVLPETSAAGDTSRTTNEAAKPQTTGELLGYRSSKSEADAPLLIFHRLTVENIASALNASIPAQPVRISLPDGSAAYMSVLTSNTLDSAHYWILTADGDTQFITLVGRVGLSQSTERVNEMIRAMHSLRLSTSLK